jgi:hypothetical protein
VTRCAEVKSGVVPLFRDYPFFFAITGGDLVEVFTFSTDLLLHQEAIVSAIRIMALPCGVWIYLSYFLLNMVSGVLFINNSLQFELK